ncbi:hypothetical protein IEQ34_006599 [Dendrobium chrysotoxum]|uniref:Uncharacterized protein n=1 Tax=Dendrobium chrysotoxum TaxID=161865 RepID=A0AAV7H749_DENCH|nr:hypothetical protein IEQ34_006599 [Dendrobium chrysotoxum]
MFDRGELARFTGSDANGAESAHFQQGSRIRRIQVTAQVAKSVIPTHQSVSKFQIPPSLQIPTSFISEFPTRILPHHQTKSRSYTMPTSEGNQISLQQQYHRLRRDWDHYKTSIPFRRRSRSTADLPSSASDYDSEFFQISCKNLASFPQCISQSERMRLEDLEKVKQAKATEIGSPLCCGNFSLSSSSLNWHEYEYENSSSDNDDDGLEEKDVLTGQKQEWTKRQRWFFIIGIGAVVAAGVCSFGALFGLDDVGQLMTPT